MTDQLLLQKTTIFDTIGLKELDETSALMNRIDTKFLIPRHLLGAMLEELQPHYRLLQATNQLWANYQTLYFDTRTLQMYHAHQTGRLNRYKVRQRHYAQSELVFTEVKFKNNKGRTVKQRIGQQHLPSVDFEPAVYDFLTQKTPFEPAQLQPVLWVEYNRLTLVSGNTAERLTLDLDLQFRHQRQQHGCGQVVVAELKQPVSQPSLFLDLMHRYHLRKGALSKYCWGMISLHQNLKYNRFKSKINHLNKIIAHHDIVANQ